LLAERFEPTRIQLASGEFCDIGHPDSVFIHDHQLLIIDRVEAAGQVIRSYRFVDMQLIKDVIPIRLAGPQTPRDELADHEIMVPATRFISWMESLLSLMAAGLICTIVAFSGMSLYLNTGKTEGIEDIGALIAWGLLILIEVVLLLRIARFYQKRLYPLPLLYALAYEPPTAAVTRFALAGFWLAHAIAGVFAFAWVELFFFSINGGRGIRENWFNDMILLIFVWAGTHASMMFFLLTVRSGGATPRMLRRFWRFRVVIDISIVTGVALFPDMLLVLLRPISQLTRNLQYLIGH
jgi:hypothetical protein